VQAAHHTSCHQRGCACVAAPESTAIPAAKSIESGHLAGACYTACLPMSERAMSASTQDVRASTQVQKGHRNTRQSEHWSKGTKNPPGGELGEAPRDPWPLVKERAPRALFSTTEGAPPTRDALQTRHGALPQGCLSIYHLAAEPTEQAQRAMLSTGARAHRRSTLRPTQTVPATSGPCWQ
jgi:hypothetical protein